MDRPRPAASIEIPGIRMGAAGYDLPPGMRLPPVIANTPRPVHLQEQSHSCVLACVRMVSDTVTRVPVEESLLKQMVRGPTGYQPGVGTEGPAMAEMLTMIGVSHNGWGRASYETLASKVKNGYPAIVTYGSNHVAVVDGVVRHAGDEWVLLRNPANPAHWDAETARLFQATGFGNYVAMTRREFMALFEAGGSQAVFTRP
ncbi:MAG: papain-like cysteine protease family protein [Burkholderiaceae bacterium]